MQKKQTNRQFTSEKQPERYSTGVMKNHHAFN